MICYFHIEFFMEGELFAHQLMSNGNLLLVCCGHTVSNPEVFEVATILSFSVCGLTPVVVVTSTVNGNCVPSTASLDNWTIISNIKELISKKSLDDTDVVPKINNNTHTIRMQKYLMARCTRYNIM